MLRITAPPSAEPAQAQARTFNLNIKYIDKNPDVIPGTLLVNVVNAKVLIDSGTTRSFVSKDFMRRLNCETQMLEGILNDEIANQDQVSVTQVCPHYEINIYGHLYYINLLSFKLGEYDVILGIDWLSEHETQIDCRNKKDGSIDCA